MAIQAGDDILASHFNEIVPIGVIFPYAGSTAPTGFLLCDGSSLLRAGTYAALFAIIGTDYGSVDGTHFNIPDTRGKFLVGKDGTSDFDVLGETGGQRTINLAHTHSFSATTGFESNLAGTTGYDSGGGEVADRNHTHGVSGTTGSSLSATQSVLPPYFVVNHIIKYISYT